MDALQTARTNLLGSFNKEFYTLEKAVSEEVTRLAKADERYKNIEPTVPFKDFASLRERYTSLTQQYSNLQTAHNKAIEKWRAAKAHIKTWEAYHQRCKARERAKNAKEYGAEHGRRHDSDTGATGVGLISHPGTRHDALLNRSAIPFVSPMLLPGLNGGIIPPLQGLVTPAEARNNTSYPAATKSILEQKAGNFQDQDNPNRSVHHDREANGQEYGADELPTPKPTKGLQATAGKPMQPDMSGYSSDQPVVVSERSLKKRKRHSNVHTPGVSVNEDVREVGSKAKPLHVKSENDSSSPAAAGRRELVMQDSLDLDDVGTRVITPRKRRRLEELLRLSQSNSFAAAASVEVGLAARDNQPLEGPMAAKPSDTKKQDRWRLSRATKQPTSIGKGTEQWIEPKDQLTAVVNRSILGRKDDELEASTSFQRPKQPLQALNANILHPQSPEQSNILAEVISSAALNTPEKGNDHQRLESQNLKVDDEPVRASSAPPKTGVSSKHYPDKLEAGAAMVLQPTNPNAQIQPRTSGPTSTPKGVNHKSKRDRSANCVPFVTEDGENFRETTLRRGAEFGPGHGLQETGELLRQHDRDKADLQIHRRLACLLDEPSPEKPLLSTTSPAIKATKEGLKRPLRPRAHSRTRDDDSDASVELHATTATLSRGPSPTYLTRKACEPPPTGEMSKKNKRPALAGQQPPPTSSKDPDPNPINPDHKPLRTRPLHGLGPDDFKINPDNAQGLDYAFTEVVRKHDQRRCLPGCTRPSCCGPTFRKLVEIGGLPTPRTSGLWSSSSPEDKDQDTQEQADARLLKAYLGADHERRVAQMSEAERKEVVLDAKTRVFADRHGRHRQAYERRTTPPGFWRADMPSTQELEMDREEARLLERRRVEEMYREAMREGGRWRFRDE